LSRRRWAGPQSTKKVHAIMRPAEGGNPEQAPINLRPEEAAALGEAVGNVQGALRGAPLTPELAVIDSPALRRAVAVLHRFQEVNGVPALQDMADRLIVQLESDKMDLDIVTGDIALWMLTGIPMKDVRSALSEAAALLTLGNGQAMQVVLEDVADNGEMKATIDGKDVTFQLGRSAEQLMWGDCSRFVICYAPDSINGKRVVMWELQDDGKFGFMKLQKGDILYLAPPDRAVILDIAQNEKLPEVARNYLAARDSLPRDVKDMQVVAAPDLLEAVQFMEKIAKLPQEEQDRALYKRAWNSHFGQKVRERVARDDQWRDVIAALESKGLDLYKAARGHLLRKFPAEDVQIEVNQPKAPIVVRIPRPGMGFLFLFSLIAAAVILLSPDNEQDSLPLYTMQDSSLQQKGATLRSPLAGTLLQPFS